VLNASRYDLMTYCSSRIWISPYSFQQLFDAVPAPPPARAPRQVAVVGGSIKKDGSAASLESAYLLTSSAAALAHDPRGDHCLRFSGAASSSVCFTPRFRDDQGQELVEEAFSVVVEVPEGTTKMALTRGARELASIARPASAPTVSLSGPAERSTLPATQGLTWSATSSGATTYAVMYSPDDRKTWYPLALDTTGTSVSVDTTKLAPGDGVWFRVLAADGLATAVAETGPFRVERPATLDVPLWAMVAAVAAALVALRLGRRRPARVTAAPPPPPAAPATVRFCRSCGARATPGASFCSECGSRL
jgi:hypothetical protein